MLLQVRIETASKGLWGFEIGDFYLCVVRPKFHR